MSTNEENNERKRASGTEYPSKVTNLTSHLVEASTIQQSKRKNSSATFRCSHLSRAFVWMDL